MVKKKLKSYLSFKRYFSLLKSSFLHPSEITNSLEKFQKIEEVLIFFGINIVLGLFLRILLDISKYQKINFLFSGIVESLLSLPIFYLGLFILTFFLFLIAKILQGKGGFISCLKAVCLSSAPIILYGIPLTLPLIVVFVVRLLILNFRKIHNYSLAKVIFNVVFPFLMFMLISLSLGLFTLPKI